MGQLKIKFSQFDYPLEIKLINLRIRDAITKLSYCIALTRCPIRDFNIMLLLNIGQS